MSESDHNPAPPVPADAAEQLLGLGPGLKQLLEKVVADSVVDSVVDGVVDPAPETPSRVGRYRVVRLIGEGGMGCVYEAEQDQPRRRVALKVIKPGMDTRQVIRRFNTEREALGLMDHPCIARVYDAGATEAGRPFFAMELVDGLPITDYCDQHRLPIPQRIDLFVQVCRAVQHAHQKGVIHRDLKPSNVLVATVDNKPLPKVIDFGIAKATGVQHLAGQTLLTDVQQLVGTPEYMSPEQAAGGDVDTRTDVYSLGAMLYELLTGTTPFADRQLRSLAGDEVRRIVREAEPLRPSTQVGRNNKGASKEGYGPASLRRALRGELDWIVMRCLEKDRDRRYPTAGDLAEDLARHLRNEPVHAGPPTASYRLKKFARRYRAAFAAAAAIVVLLIAGITGTTIGMLRARAAQARAEREAGKAVGTATYLESVFAYADADQGGNGPDARLIEVLDRASAEMSQRLAGQPEVEIAARFALVQTFWSLGAQEQQFLNLRRAYELVRQTGTERTRLGIQIRRTMAEFFEDLPDRETVARQTAEDARLLLGHDQVTIQAGSTFAKVLWHNNKRDEAEHILRALVDQCRQKPITDVNPFFRLGGYLAAQGRLDEAEGMLREADAWARTQWPRARHHLRILRELAAVLVRKPDKPQACDVLRTALTELGPRLGYDDEEVAQATREYLILLGELGREDQVAQLRPDVEAALARRADRPAATAAALRHRAFARAAIGRYDAAADDYTRCIALNPADHDAWCALAAVLANVPDPRYEAHCRRMLERFGGTTDRITAERTAKACLFLPRPPEECARLLDLANLALDGGKEHPYLAWFFLAKGLAEYRVGHFEAALEWSNKSRDHEQPERDAHADLLAAMAHHQLGHHEDARACLARANKLLASPTFMPVFTPMNFGFPTAGVLQREATALVSESARATTAPASESGINRGLDSDGRR